MLGDDVLEATRTDRSVECLTIQEGRDEPPLILQLELLEDGPRAASPSRFCRPVASGIDFDKLGSRFRA